jgi:hypothetical protein
MNRVWGLTSFLNLDLIFEAVAIFDFTEESIITFSPTAETLEPEGGRFFATRGRL